MKRILVTGGAGFIGSNFLNYILKTYDDIFVVNYDKLTYAGNLENLREIEAKKNYVFIKGDIVDHEQVSNTLKKYEINNIINFAAESHVDRSIHSSYSFYETNVLGTNVLLNAAREIDLEKFLQVSTDEVYGSLSTEGLFTETTALNPKNPYAASKAGADLMALAFCNTYKMPIVVTRCSNNYGPYQFPEKLIPLMVINAISNKELPVYGDGLNIRDWIYVIDHNKAIMKVLEDGKSGEVYNVGAKSEKPNIEIVKLILDYLEKPYSLIKYVNDRPGHDRRYAIDSAKLMADLNWEPEYSFDRAIQDTIKWYLDNKNWWERILSGDYQNYYKLQYQTN
ncbi:MAG: dTDP-glucose 4,6-dehydratase [Bacteroidota bacterium]|nr:dTDP-glucose 4,6-dehydratase [Bacteroidota bacterium]